MDDDEEGGGLLDEEVGGEGDMTVDDDTAGWRDLGSGVAGIELEDGRVDGDIDDEMEDRDRFGEVVDVERGSS